MTDFAFIYGDRGTGRTTSLVEAAIHDVGCAAGSNAVIVGPHIQWLREIKRLFRNEGLVGIEFMTVTEALDVRSLHGGRWTIAGVDDFNDIFDREQQILLRELQQAVAPMSGRIILVMGGRSR